MRAVVDPNVLISAVLSPRGAPAQIVSRWLAGEFELVVSDALLGELERALGYSKLRRRISPEEVGDVLVLVRRTGVHGADPPNPPRRSSDPGDDYLLALAESQRALLVSGDQHLLALMDRFPVLGPTAFLAMLTEKA